MNGSDTYNEELQQSNAENTLRIEKIETLLNIGVKAMDGGSSFSMRLVLHLGLSFSWQSML